MSSGRNKAQRRFIEGKGQRYTGGGKIRCQAVGRTKLRRMRAERNNPDLKSDDVWPEGQCVFAARPGYYVCRYHGGGKVGGAAPGRPKEKMEEKGLTKYIKKSLGQMYQEYAADPTLFDQRQNAALLSARNAELLQDLASSAMVDANNFKTLVKATDEIKSGNVTKGVALLDGLIAKVSKEREAWNEIRQNISAVKDLTNAEMSRLKEMRHMLTADQVISKFDRFADVVLRAVDQYVDDPEARKNILKMLTGGTRDFIGSTGNTVIEQVRS